MEGLEELINTIRSGNKMEEKPKCQVAGCENEATEDFILDLATILPQAMIKLRITLCKGHRQLIEILTSKIPSEIPTLKKRPRPIDDRGWDTVPRPGWPEPFIWRIQTTTSHLEVLSTRLCRVM